MMAKWLGGGRSRRRGKKVGAALAAGVVALAVLAGCGTASESGKDGGRTHISLGSAAPPASRPSYPLSTARSTGVFVDHGLDLEVVSVGDSAAAVSAVLSGSVDVMYGGLTTVASAKEAGARPGDVLRQPAHLHDLPGCQVRRGEREAVPGASRPGKRRSGA